MYDWAEFRHFWYLLTILEKKGFRPAAEQLQPDLLTEAEQVFATKKPKTEKTKAKASNHKRQTVKASAKKDVAKKAV